MKAKLLVFVTLLFACCACYCKSNLIHNNEITKTGNQKIFEELKKAPPTLTFQQSKIIVACAVSMVVLGGVITYFLYKQKRLKEIQEKSNLQQKLLHLQMNPHFIFNSLASIQNLIINKDPETANIFLIRFSNFVRNILHSSFYESNTIEKEIKTLDSYLALQKLRYAGRFDYSITLDPAVEAEYTEIPVMLLQPFVENAIEYSIKPKQLAGHIDLNCQLKNHRVVIEISDDGIGRKKAEELRLKYANDHHHMATDITRERIRIMNKKLKNKIKLDIIDLEDEHCEACGTKVVFEVPI